MEHQVMAVFNGGANAETIGKVRKIIEEGGFRFVVRGPRDDIGLIVNEQRPDYLLVFAMGWKKNFIETTIYPKLNAAIYKPDIIWVVYKGEEKKARSPYGRGRTAIFSIIAVDFFRGSSPWENLFEVLRRMLQPKQVKPYIP